MKKALILLLVFSLLLLGACSSAPQPDADTDEANTEPTSAQNDGGELNIKITPKHDEIFADDGTLVFTSDITVPAFTGGCADAIALDFSEVLDQVDAECMDIISAARETYAEWEGGEFPVYQDDLSVTVTRNDGKLLSLCCDSYVFMGYEEGTAMAQGVNYSAQTGERLTLEDICSDSASFIDLLYDRAVSSIENGGYELNDDWLEILRDDLDYGGNWCLDDDGMVLLFGSYEFTPQSDSVISVCIPYSEISEYIGEFCPAR